MSDFWWTMNNSVKWSWTWDHRWVVHVRPIFGRMVPGMTSLLLQRCHCSSLIFICTNKIVMNIWILYYSILFLHISILYNLICLIIFFFYYSIQFYINDFVQFYFLKYFLIITDGITDGINPSIFYRELEKIYCICHNHRQKYRHNQSVGTFQRVGGKNYYICHYHRWKYTDIIILSVNFQWEIFLRSFFFCKTICL